MLYIRVNSCDRADLMAPNTANPIEYRYDIGEIKGSQRTPEGYEKLYVRMAKADHPYKYFNQDGTKRIELITLDDLTDPASLRTAKNLPILSGHPSFKLDSKSIGGHIQGVVGERFLKEETDQGTFLGAIVTLHTDEAQQIAKRQPGVSPGYRTKIARRDSESFWQHSREYNHLAAGVVPRGGKGVNAMPFGVRVDSEGEDPPVIWVAEADDCYRCDVNEDFVARALDYRGDAHFLERSVIDLTPFVKQPEQPVHHDDSCGCDKCSHKEKDPAKPTAKKKKKKTRKDSTKGRIRNMAFDATRIDWDGVNPDIVATVTQELARLDGVDALAEENASLSATVEELTAELAAANTRYDSLAADFQEYEEEVEAAENLRLDAEEEDDELIRFDEDTYLDHVIAGVTTCLQMRKDADLLYDIGALRTRFDASPEEMVNKMRELQSQMIGIASPSLADRVDGFDDETLAQTYENTFIALRDHAERNARNRQDSRPLSGVMSIGQRMAPRQDSRDRQDSRRGQNARNPYGLNDFQQAEMSEHNDVFNSFSQQIDATNKSLLSSP